MTGARSRPCGTRARAGLARKARQDAFCRLKGGGLREFVWVVASSPRWHGPQVRAPWRHGAMGPSMSWDPWPRPVARAAVGMQECTQIGENGLSAQPPLACRMRLSVMSRWRRWCRMRFSVTSRWRRWCRMRFSVASPAQNALFRRVRFSSPAQTWSHLTQRRILRRRSHVKAHSAPAVSRKGALRATARMQSAPFGEARTQNALFREGPHTKCAFP